MAEFLSEYSIQRWLESCPQSADLSQLEPEEMERVLAVVVLEEFKVRLARIGLEYQTPSWS